MKRFKASLAKQLKAEEKQRLAWGKQRRKVGRDPVPEVLDIRGDLDAMMKTACSGVADLEQLFFPDGRDRRVELAQYALERAENMEQEFHEDVIPHLWSRKERQLLWRRIAMCRAAGLEVTDENLCNPSLDRLVETSEIWAFRGLGEYIQERCTQLDSNIKRAVTRLVEFDEILAKEDALREAELDAPIFGKVTEDRLAEIAEAEEDRLILIAEVGDELESWAARQDLGALEENRIVRLKKMIAKRNELPEVPQLRFV